MKFLKLNCNGELRGPEAIEVQIPGTTKKFNLWIVAGEGVEVTYDQNGNETVVGTFNKYIGINVKPKYRMIKCNSGENDVVWGVEEIELI